MEYEKQSPQFQSFQGLHQIITSKSKLAEQIEAQIEWLGRYYLKERKPPKKHPSIRLLDTFFSDTLYEALLANFVSLSRDHGLEIKILLLEPLSRLAASRAKGLGLNSINEINKALFNIHNSLLVSNGEIPNDIAEYVGEF